MLFRRIIDSLVYAFRYRKWLRLVLERTDRNKKIVDINVLDFKKQGINVLALDFDGVLAAHGIDVPRDEVKRWIIETQKHFPKGTLFVLSNRPSGKRIAYFKQHFPDIVFISKVRKKPYPDGMLKIIEISQCRPEQLLVIDDRLLTGAVAAHLAGSEVCYIANPYVNIRNKPLKELFFKFLRWSERLFIGGWHFR